MFNFVFPIYRKYTVNDKSVFYCIKYNSPI